MNSFEKQKVERQPASLTPAKPSVLIQIAVSIILVITLIASVFFSMVVLVAVFAGDIKPYPPLFCLTVSCSIFYYVKKFYGKYMSQFKAANIQPDQNINKGQISEKLDTIEEPVKVSEQTSINKLKTIDLSVPDKMTYGVDIYVSSGKDSEPDKDGWFRGIEAITDAYNNYMNDPENEWLSLADHSGEVFKWIYIEYTDKDGDFTDRKVFLMSVFEHRNEFYLTGFCALRQEIRTFRKSRISNFKEIKHVLDEAGIVFRDIKPRADYSIANNEPVKPPPVLSGILLNQTDIPEIVSFGDSRFFQRHGYNHEIIDYFGKAHNKVSALFSANGNPAVYVAYGWASDLRRFIVSNRSWQYGYKPQNYKAIEEWIIKEWEQLNTVKPHVSSVVIGNRDMTAFFPKSDPDLVYVFINDWDQHTYHLVKDVWNSTYKRTKNQNTENWLRDEWGKSHKHV